MGEELLKRYMADGWNIDIECKGMGRTYGMTYEATAHHVDWSIEERIYNFKHGVGNTLEELLHDLFFTLGT